MMKIAVLILSNSSLDALPMHEEYWDGRADLYIHVDSKNNKQIIPNLRYAHVIEQIRVFWGGWSMIIATMNLISYAQKFDDYDRFVLISDDSAPLLSVDNMIRRLSAPIEYIWSDLVGDGEASKRYSEFYFVDHPAVSIGFVGIEFRSLDSNFFDSVRDAEKLRERGKKPIDLRYGNQWWALTSSTIGKIQKSYIDDCWLRDSFRFSAVPDEHYIPTILGESFRENFMYSDITPHVGTTIFNSVSDIQNRNIEDYLFIRKINCKSNEMSYLIKNGLLI